MNLKTSFFNFTIFKSDLKRFWWTSLAETLLVILFCIFPTYDKIINMKVYTVPQWEEALIFPLIFGIAVANLVFGYLHSSRSATTLHAYPITRTSLYVTKLISGLVLLLIPLIINGVILGGLSFITEFKKMYGLVHVMKWVAVGISYSAIIFSLCTAVNMMTGNSIAAIVFTLGYIILPFFLMNIVEFVLSEELYGFFYNKSNKVLEYLYIYPKFIRNGSKAVFYPIYSLMLLGLGYGLYKICKIECHGEIIAFKWLKPVFIGIIAFLSCGFGYAYLVDVLNMGNIFVILPFGILGTAIAYMISKKSLDFKGCIKPALIYALIALVFIGVIKLDLIDFKTKVPSDNEVLQIELITPEHLNNADPYGYENMPVFKEKKSIELITTLHRNLIDVGFKEKYGPTVLIRYTLKDGSHLVREYPFDAEKTQKYLDNIYETAEFKKGFFNIFNTAERDFETSYIHDNRVLGYISIEEAKYNKFIEALKKDLVETPFEDINNYYNSENEHQFFRISWEEPVYVNGVLTDTRYYDETYPIRPYYKNTQKVLDEILSLHLPTSENITSIRVSADNGVMNYKTVTVTQKDLIEKIYEKYDEMSDQSTFSDQHTAIHIELVYALNNNHVFTIESYYDEDKLPEVFKNLIQ